MGEERGGSALHSLPTQVLHTPSSPSGFYGPSFPQWLVCWPLRGRPSRLGSVENHHLGLLPSVFTLEMGQGWGVGGGSMSVCVQSLSQVQFFCNPTDCSLQSSSVHVVSQARILGWVAMSCGWSQSPWAVQQDLGSCSPKTHGWQGDCTQVSRLPTQSPHAPPPLGKSLRIPLPLPLPSPSPLGWCSSLCQGPSPCSLLRQGPGSSLGSQPRVSRAGQGLPWWPTAVLELEM